MEPVTIAVVLAGLVGLVLALYQIWLPARFAAVAGFALIALLMALLLVVTRWTVEKAHEFLRHFRPRPRHL